MQGAGAEGIFRRVRWHGDSAGRIVHAPSPPPLLRRSTVSDFRLECAWCGTPLEGPGDASPPSAGGLSHGICLDCLGGMLQLPVTDMHALTTEEVDRLPFGLLELTRMGVVRRYNAAEAQLSGLSRETVVGKDFFREVAPCTRATEFEEHWRRLLREGGGDADFEFVFKFRSGHRLVRIRMLVSPELDRTLILVQDLERSDTRTERMMDEASRPRSSALG